MNESNVFTRLVGPTEGEWSADRYSNDFEVVIKQHGREPWRLAGYIEREEDARLMAAAPELLEAARDAIHMIQCIAENWPEQVGILSSFRDAVHARGVRVPSVQDRLKAAIAKAEGR